MLSTARKDWLWKIEGGMSLNCACTGRLEGRPAAFTGGADGFVIAADLADGRILRSWHAGDPVVGLTQDAAGRLIVATRTGVRTLDAAWHATGTLTRGVRRLLPLSDGRVVINRDDHTLELLQPQ